MSREEKIFEIIRLFSEMTEENQQKLIDFERESERSQEPDQDFRRSTC